METRRHPDTGEVLTRGERPMTARYGGHEITFMLPGWYPEGSDEGVHDGPDMAASDRALNILRARVAGLPEPTEVFRIRKKLKLTQRAAGEIIGGGPKAFQKYESGEVLASRAIANLLFLLDRHPDELKVLKERAEAQKASATADRREEVDA